ncbi:MAG: flagellar basal body-associated FliL family protein [Proteobacteria bacterium]|nr:flagellar basal body-associated FliL family protein [Pseudomonadota bacterium]MBS0572865.1 flagellar basal body-associated FliL family protein [Pseudomonadota bacterium]
MRKLVLPILLALAGLGGGAGAGLYLRPADAGKAEAAACGPAVDTAAGGGGGGAALPEGEAPAKEYVKLNNQFIVPVVESGRVGALVILSVSLEVPFGGGEKVYAVEPKLRDAFLQVLFDHANAGGFDGAFTSSDAMDGLRAALLETAKRALGHDVTDVLITDIVRQDS